MILIKEDDVKNILTMEDTLIAVEDAHRSLGVGNAVITPRKNLWLKPKVSIKTASAALMPLGFMGTIVYPGGFGKKGSGSMITLLYDSNDGRLLSIIESRLISWFRTGATSAVAAKYLATKNANSIGIFGTGRQAQTQLLALQKTLKPSIIKVYSPTREHRNKFATEMSKKIGTDIKPVEDPQSCLTDVDVIITITTSKEPVFDGKMLKKGTHVNAIGAHYPDIREVDTDTVKRSKIFVDSRTQALEEKGELLIPISQGIITSNDIYAELGEVIAGKTKGRVDQDEITLFCAGGLALEGIAVAARVYELAKKNGVGVEI